MLQKIVGNLRAEIENFKRPTIATDLMSVWVDNLTDMIGQLESLEVDENDKGIRDQAIKAARSWRGKFIVEHIEVSRMSIGHRLATIQYLRSKSANG